RPYLGAKCKFRRGCTYRGLPLPPRSGRSVPRALFASSPRRTRASREFPRPRIRRCTRLRGGSFPTSHRKRVRSDERDEQEAEGQKREQRPPPRGHMPPVSQVEQHEKDEPQPGGGKNLE